MKKIISILMIVMLMVFAAGCGGGASEASSAGQADAAADEAAAEDTAADEAVSNEAAAEDTAEADEEESSDVDVDLSSLSSTMVYGQVYDMLTKPDEFMGKTIKASGIFAVYTDQATGKNYYACVIQDATACCQQGIEFELKGRHDYPEDYPEVGSEVTIVGTFDTYEENGATYCTLRKAKIV